MRPIKAFLLLCLLALATGNAQAIPLRELIFETMNQEHQGVLTPAQISTARKLGAKWYRLHGAYFDIDTLAKVSARTAFPYDVAKQKEWVLECQIGNMMAVEAALWTP